jgi:hypothetical protein
MKNNRILFVQSILKPFIGLLFLAALGIECTTKSDVLELVKNGKSDYKIYVSEKAIASEKHAATELQKYIFEISESKLPITNKVDETSKIIYIGFNDVPKNLLQDIEVSSFGNEEFIIKTSAKSILIGGGETRGTLYGVISFLADYLGCRWYTPEFSKIPKNKNISLEQINKREKPVFEYREAWYNEAYKPNWAVHNRLNPSLKAVPEEMGGGYKIYPFVHTFYSLVDPDKYFESHPEYFSLVDGKRLGDDGQLCLTNPDVLRIAIETAYSWIEENPNVSVLSIDQNDGYRFCECDNCKAIDDREGSQSGTILTFANQIADTIGKTNPDLKIQTLAYAYSEVPPKTIVPRPNVTIRLCHYDYCSAHSIEGCENHKVFRERLKAWSKIANQITIWDYYTDFYHYLIPFPNFESLKNDVKFYADNNCIGLFAQGCNVSENGGGEFSSLRAWVFSKLMWNPYQDAQKLIDEFVENVYGNASSYIKAYIELLHEKVKLESVYFSIFSNPSVGGYLTPEIIEKSKELFKLAEESVSNNPDLLRRVELAGLPVLYAQLYFYSIGGHAYLSPKNMPSVLSKFKRIIKEHNIIQLAERENRGNVDEFIKKVQNQYLYKTSWWTIGPFNNQDKNGLHTKYPPENEFDLKKSYLGKNNETINWRFIENKQFGYMDFIKFFDDAKDGVAYAKTIVELKQAGKIKIGLGSNDGVKLWVNGELVHTNKTTRIAEPNQDIITVNMRKGKNNVLIKVDQTDGGWGFSGFGWGFYFTFIEGTEFIL